MWRFGLVAIAFVTASFISAQTADPAAQAQRASELVAAGKAEEAIPIYARLVHDYPGRPELLLNLCIAEFKAKRYEDAITHANDALKLNQNLAPADLFLGAAYFELGRLAVAVAPLQKAVRAMPADHNARLMLGEALLGSKRNEEALEQLQEASKLLPQNPRAWYGLGQVYDSLAEQCRSQLRTLAPDSAYRWALEGDFYLDQRKFGSAIAAYREALGKGPPLPGIHAALARAYLDTGHPDWAAKEEAAEKMTPPSSNASDGAEASYSRCQSYRQESANAYAQLGALSPSLESHLHMAKKLDAEGQYREASKEWKSCLDLDPGNSEAELGLAWSLYRLRDYDPVLNILKRVLARDAKNAQATFLYGASLLNLEQADAAIPYLENALKLDPELRAADAALGQALLRTGKAADAIPHLNAAILNDEDGNTHFQLFRAYQQTGRVELAKQAFAEYQALHASAARNRAMEDGSQLRSPGV